MKNVDKYLYLMGGVGVVTSPFFYAFCGEKIGVFTLSGNLGLIAMVGIGVGIFKMFED